MIKTNKTYTRNSQIRLRYDYKVDVQLIKDYLLALDIDNLGDELVKYNDFLNSNSSKNKYTHEYRFQIKEENINQVLVYLDSIQVNINYFIKYIIHTIAENDNTIHCDPRVTTSKVLVNNRVNIDQIKGREDDVLEFFREFLIYNNSRLLSNKDIILSGDQRQTIITNISNLTLDIIRVFKQNRLDIIATNGYTKLELKEFYRENIRLLNDLKSNTIKQLLFKFKELCYIDNQKIISDELRYRILVNYFDLWILKTNVIIDELNQIGFRWDFTKTKYYQAKFIEKVNLSERKEFYEKNNAYISSDVEFKNESFLLPFFYSRGNKHRSAYIKKNVCKKLFKLGDQSLTKEEFMRLPDQDKKHVKVTCVDNLYLNVYCDSETNWQFLYKLKLPELKAKKVKITPKHIIKLDTKEIANLENGEQIIKLHRDEFMAMRAVNIKYLEEFDITNHPNYKQVSNFDNENYVNNDDLIKFNWYAQTEIKIHQSVFVNERTKTAEYVIIVDERNRHQYNKDTLSYEYERKFKDKVTINQVTAKIIYTKEVVRTFIDYLTNWYRLQHQDVDSKKMNCRLWYHNLKFDSLAIGLQNVFKQYDWELMNYKTSTPVFYKFKTDFREINRKGKEIQSYIEFIDSFNFVNQSLANLGLQVGIRKEKEKIDLNWNDNLAINKKTLEYSLMDVVLLKEFIEDLKQKALKYAPFTKYGAAGSAMNSYYTMFYGEEKDYTRPMTRIKTTYYDADGNELTKGQLAKIRRNDKKNGTKTALTKVKIEYQDYRLVQIHKHKNRILEEIEQYSYTGGRTQILRMLAKFKKYMSIDLNSSYPSSMLQKMPYEYKESIQLDHLTRKQAYELMFKYFNDDSLYTLTRVFIPHDDHLIVPNKRDSMVCFDELYNVTTVLHEPELKLLLERNKKISILEVHVYYASDKLFKGFVDEFMYSKSYHKSITGDDIAVTWAKLNANSLYGKFAEKELISLCREMNPEEKEFFRCLLSIKHNSVVSFDDMDTYLGYIDIPIDPEVFNYRTDHNFAEFNGLDLLTYEDIYTNLIDMIDVNCATIRIEFFNGYFSFSKKSNKPGTKSSLIIAGAITSYSRAALYKCIEIMGFDRVFYCDTDSVYFEIFDHETYEDIEKKFINKIDIDKEALKIKLKDKASYLEYLKDIEENHYDRTKINCSKGIVSKLYFWEIELQEPGEMLTRGNKDNLKCTWVKDSNIKIYHNETQKQQLIVKYGLGDHDKEDVKDLIYLIDYKDLKYIKINENLFNRETKRYKIKTNEKNKGISSKALQVNENLYIVPMWLSIKSCMNEYNLDGQYVRDFVKYLGGRDHYQKDNIIFSESRQYEYLEPQFSLDKYSQPIKGIRTIKIKTISYTHQEIKPFQVSNVGQNEKYYNNHGFEKLETYEKFTDYIKENEIKEQCVNTFFSW